MKCTKCGSENTYQDGALWICPECFHEFTESAVNQAADDEESAVFVVKDAHGNILQDGDSVVLVKDLKLKGSSSVIKGGTKVKSIRLQEGNDGHNIGCKIDGVGAINLKSEYVKKV
jgi:protein PhnA